MQAHVCDLVSCVSADSYGCVVPWAIRTVMKCHRVLTETLTRAHGHSTSQVPFLQSLPLSGQEVQVWGWVPFPDVTASHRALSPFVILIPKSLTAVAGLASCPPDAPPMALLIPCKPAASSPHPQPQTPPHAPGFLLQLPVRLSRTSTPTPAPPGFHLSRTLEGPQDSSTTLHTSSTAPLSFPIILAFLKINSFIQQVFRECLLCTKHCCLRL